MDFLAFKLDFLAREEAGEGKRREKGAREREAASTHMEVA